ncbi:Pca regulon regulatory protein PcaR [Actinomycetales bacterium JB111]|nr:Pca regulon regulatory protein PcaR [Actinomycetales bacterium JB111]
MTDVEPASAPRREAMGGLAKGLAILELFGPELPRLTVAEAARGTGLSPASARRCLLTLEESGYVTHDGKFFRPAPRLVRLGSSFLETSDLPGLATPCVDRARDDLDESVSVAIQDDSYVVFVARAEVRRIVAAGVRLGARLPVLSSASGRVLLAAQPPEATEALLANWSPTRSTPATLDTPDAIRERIDRAREDGYSMTDEELESGMRTLSVPVVDSRGTTRAAMSVAAFTSRATVADLVDRFVPVLRREADRLGRTL